jgi:nicotinamide-nucleotide amidase
MSNFESRLTDRVQRLGRLLHEQRLMLAVAESCTAGGLGYALTQAAGASDWFDRGYITYSNDAKQQMLGVPAAYLRNFGAVSEPVARAMAGGALAQGRVQMAASITGIAGPTGATEGKPVGTVCFGWAIQREPTATPWAKTETRHFDGDRAAVREQSIAAAVDGLIDLLEHRQDV